MTEDPRGDEPGTGSTPLAHEVLELLAASGGTLAVAESVTGGLVTSTLVAVPGASVVLRGGVVAYASAVKHLVLGVDLDLLAVAGPVHPDVAIAMALGARDRLDATWAVATTGVAGPDPQDGQPVGTVHVAVTGPHEVITCRRHLFLGGRAAIRQAAVHVALELLRDQLVERSDRSAGGRIDHADTEPSATRVTAPLGTVSAP